MTGVISWLVQHYQLFLLLPILIALKAEKYYTGRVSLVSNTTSMFVSTAPFWDVTRSVLNIDGFPLFHAYLILGLAVGILAFLSYLSGSRQPSYFYDLGWLLYNSLFATIVCLYASTL